MIYKHFQQFLMRLYQTETCQGLLRDEKSLIDYALRKSFGLYVLQIGLTSWRPLLDSCRLTQKILVDDSIVEDFFDAYIVADLNYLPIRKDSVDMVFLPHTLETVEDPYHLLRQIDDLLIAEGKVLLTGFNPIGCAVFMQKVGQNKAMFKQANLISPARIVDWLRLLGYDIEWVGFSATTCLANSKPSGKIARRLGQALSFLGLETGNVYAIMAKKRISSPTPVGLNWKLSDWMRVRKVGKSVSAASRQEPAAPMKNAKMKKG